MYELIIKEYINKLNIDDIKNYAYNNNIIIDDKEANNIYDFIIRRWKELYKTRDINILYELKDKVNDNTFQNILNLFNNYNNKY